MSTPEADATTRSATPRSRPGGLPVRSRVVLLVLALAAMAGTLGVTVLPQLSGPAEPLGLPWLVWAAAFATGEFLVVHIQLQRDSHSFSMTDLVLVAGLYLLEPEALVPALVTGVGLALVLHRRQFGLKLAFNLAQYGLAGCLAAITFATLGRNTVLAGAWDWIAALAAIGASTTTAGLCIWAVMRVSQPTFQLRELGRILGLSLPFALGVAAVGLLAANTAAQSPASLGLLALPSGLLIAAYRAYAKAREQQNNLRVLHEITSLLYNSDDAQTALTDFLTAVRGAFKAGNAELVLFGDEGAPPTLSRSREGDKPVALQVMERTEDADAMVAWATGTGEHTTRTGLGHDSALERYVTRHTLKDGMVSLLETDGRVQGLLMVTGRLGDVGTFAGSDLALLETFARHVATSLDRGRLETDLRRVIELQEELRHAAMHDPLTELPNRTLFLDRTEHDLHLAGRNGQWPAVLYIDLDGFKPVNDTYGHQAGDLLLKVFAQRLHDCVRTADTPARLGGDEFAVLLHGPIDEAGVHTALDRIRVELDRPVELGGGRTAKVGASIGVAFSDRDTDIDGLIRRADLAMYTAKRGGRGISVFYDPSLEAAEPSEPQVDDVAAGTTPAP
ncbi:MAG: sensor diguanylate cyclase [Blastococcus sp.]|jgi:diguanylate cyclase (GGDEF)-like protein|nr:sensor diguanylate cyclase [Blastococcus sp.]